MIRNRTIKFTCCFRICLFQFGYFSFGFRVQLACITSLYHRLCSIVFSPDIITESTLTSCLQSRTVSTESNQIIFPCHVIYTFRIVTSTSLCIKYGRSTGLNSISRCSVSFYGSRENYFLIISNLIGHLLTISIKHNNLSSVSQLQLRRDITHGYLYHFTGTLHSGGICYCNSNRLALSTSKAYKSNCNKEK